jgi:glucosylceramidase
MALVHRPSLLAVGLLALAMAGAPGRVGLAEAQLATTPPMPSAHVWVSTPDGTHRMDDGGTVAFHRGGSSRLTITVDPSLRYQQMDGFGASITDSSASVLYSLDQATRDATMGDLFAGNRISLLRQPIGASDFVDGPHYTYDDMPPGQTDYTLEHFTIDHDKQQILPLLRQALALDPSLKVIASPWSPLRGRFVTQFAAETPQLIRLAIVIGHTELPFR